MNLIIELGNTHTKVASFLGNELKHISIHQNHDFILESIRTSDYQAAILAGSGATDVAWWSDIKAEKKIKFHRDFIKNIHYEYTTPQTLGEDRLINAWYAHQKFPTHHNLIIDTGTCITFTLIDRNNRLLGGSISPGLAIRAKSLNDYTARLPLVAIDTDREVELIGMNTESSIYSGIVLGTLYELDKRIEHYNAKFPDLNIIMTGGGTHFFENKLNYKIFADAHFTLKGLNEILISHD